MKSAWNRSAVDVTCVYTKTGFYCVM